MSHVEIHKNKPMPSSNGYKQKYPWEKMDVGDAFKHDHHSTKYSYTLANWANKRFPDRSFVARKLDDGMWIWRTK